MSDIIDRANDQAQEELERNLAKAARFDQPSLAECVECGEDIPERRRRLGGVTRCIDCQSVIERRR
ncbi:transcriptional regulator, TraR/DksA family [Psychrobacter pacificensis]|uniref:Conjugal transfer protein TraR n=1 Tax=Psychrobacter pacificensis TaxID=112002 RepID=A0A1G7B195_9GAMM|nr:MULTISPECIES: TraR/DksA C4-type zinc finger protein [Psychrobacter]BBI68735.1 conjugal transfer protein TraR [Psychrobacter sp. KH172YL61]GLR27784.1 conjugal transfer protein TraR [Psychrobacter pacificensis]GLR28978.1 conjugal transfer protein TraR [Psychrobacter pacificensis]SDE20793.1 transcriptional regulator, TraR/DksA family [Psychrobacter pacificensis]|tara:strand:- start:537 stop:734 length:198 start_codon:yes stop_codon:yes gene_type:complete